MGTTTACLHRNSNTVPFTGFNHKKTDVSVRVEADTTAAAFKGLLAQKLNIPADHLTLSVNQGIVCHKFTVLNDEQCNTSEISSPGEERALADDELILSAMKKTEDVVSREKIGFNGTKETTTIHSPKTLFYTFSKCADSLHCPRIVTIQTITGNQKVIQLNPEMTGAQLKQAISNANWLDIMPSQQRLIYNGSEILDDSTLLDQGIKDTDTIQLVIRLRSLHPVATISALDGQKVKVEFEKHWKGHELREKVSEQLPNVKSLELRLMHNGKPISDLRTLESQGIDNGAEIQVALQPETTLFLVLRKH